MSKKIEDLAEEAKKIAEDAGARLEALKDSEEVEKLKAVAKELGSEAAAVVRKYPLQSVLGAAVAGFLLGTMGRRK